MATEHAAPIETYSESDVALAFRHAVETGRRVRVVSGDEEYELDVRSATDVSPIDANDREGRELGGIERAAGGWQGLIDVDAFIEELYESRRRVGRPPVDLDR